MFIGHETVGSAMAQERLRELNFSNADIDRIVGIIRNHMLKYEQDWSDATIRRWINKVGVENVADLITFKKADCRASRANCDEAMDELSQRISTMPSPVTSVRTLAISGHDVMRERNLAPGPEIGRILKELKHKLLPRGFNRPAPFPRPIWAFRELY